MDIPGFYFDVNTNRYYREQSNPVNNNTRDVVQVYNSVKGKGILNLLRSREIGTPHSINKKIESSFTNYITDMKLGARENINDFIYPQSHELVLVKGCPRSVFALWSFQNNRQSDLTQVFLNSQVYDMVGRINMRGIQDFCVPSSTSIVIIANDIAARTSRLKIINRNSVSYNIKGISREGVYSCSSNWFLGTFAVGCEKKAVVLNTERNYRDVQPLMGRAHSLHYNTQGNALYCGVHTGHLYSFDLRDDNSIFLSQIFKTGIGELLLLSDDYSLICEAFDGEMVKIDVRMRKEVCKFFGNPGCVRKNALSANESINVLCSTGPDNQTRLWSLNGGFPVKIISPPGNEEASKAWLLDTFGCCEVYLFQGRYLYRCKVETLS